jgi:hypothetical protein
MYMYMYMYMYKYLYIYICICICIYIFIFIFIYMAIPTTLIVPSHALLVGDWSIQDHLSRHDLALSILCHLHCYVVHLRHIIPRRRATPENKNKNCSHPQKTKIKTKAMRSCQEDVSPEVMPCALCSVYPCPLSQQLPPSPVHVQPYQHTSEMART